MWKYIHVPSFHRLAKAVSEKLHSFPQPSLWPLSQLGEVERHDGGWKQYILRRTTFLLRIDKYEQGTSEKLKRGSKQYVLKRKNWIEIYKEGISRKMCWLFLIVSKEHYNQRRRDRILTKSAEKLQEVSELGETGHPEEFRYKPPSIGETRHPRRKCFSVQSFINSDIHLRRVHSRPNFR